jgi:hypothetical protein
MRRATALLLAVSVLSSTLEGQTIAFEPARTYGVGNGPEAMVCGDLNGDEKNDLVTANTGLGDGAGGNAVTVLLSRGDGTFIAHGPFPAGDRPEGVAVGHFNADSKLDVVTANMAGNSISVLAGKGSGELEQPVTFAVAGGPRSVTTADFNGDGAADLATANSEGNTVTILLGDGQGDFSIKSTLPAGAGPEVIAAGHLTADPYVDLVVCNADDNSVTPLVGDGIGGFLAGPLYTVGEKPRFLLAADLDGDGLDDLIVANRGANTISLEKNYGNLFFASVLSLSYSSTDISLVHPMYLDLADVNGDGLVDLVSTWAESNFLAVFPRTAAGMEFGSPFLIPTGNTPIGVVARDLDADGDVDVAVANTLDNSVSTFQSYLTDPGIIVDEDSVSTRALGDWGAWDAPFAFGAGSLAGGADSRFSWEASLPSGGVYEVLLWWPFSSKQCARAPVEVAHSAGKSTVVVDQAEGTGVWHSLGCYPFDSKAVVTLLSTDGDPPAVADAVRFRASPGASPSTTGKAPVTLRKKPKDISLGGTTVLAFHGTLASSGASEPMDWTGATFSPVGGEESQRILQCRLYADSNESGTLDSSDEQLGGPESFTAQDRAITFHGFSRILSSGESVDFFVACDKLEVTAAPSRAGRRHGLAIPVSAALLAAVLVVARRRNGALRMLCGLLFVAAILAWLPLGCSDGGGGGAKPAELPTGLQLELSTVILGGSSTGAPTTIQGLPLEGWSF